MTLLLRRTRSWTCSICSRVSPVAVRMSSQETFLACSANSANPVGRLDEAVVQHLPWPGVLGLQQQQVQRLEEREIATGTDLQELIGDGGATADQAAGLLRVLEPDQPGLGQRVHSDDLAAVALGLLQSGEHPRMVGAGVLAHDEDQVCVVDVVQAHAALADAERLLQCEAAGLMAHVAAVGQVVGAVGPGEELEEERGFVAQPTRGVEEGFVRGVQPGQLRGEQVERVVPADRFVVARTGPLDHGLGEPALLIEPVVGLPAQLRDRVPAEEVGGHPARGRLVVDVLGAVLAVLVHVPMARSGLRPSAARAVEALGLVDVQQCQRGPPDRGLAQGVLNRMRHPRQSGRPGLGRGDLQTVVCRVFDGAQGLACAFLLFSRSRRLGCRSERRNIRRPKGRWRRAGPDGARGRLESPSGPAPVARTTDPVRRPRARSWVCGRATWRTAAGRGR